jgi:hypothetical protein
MITHQVCTFQRFFICHSYISPVFAYGIGDGTTLHMIGNSEHPPSKNAPVSPNSKEPPQRPTEHSLISKIQGEVQRIRDSLVPPLETFLDSLESPSPPPKPELEREHVRLGELLLQSLLRLDALAPEGNWEDARLVRKGAVREVQGLLDKLDGGWQDSKSQLVRYT